MSQDVFSPSTEALSLRARPEPVSAFSAVVTLAWRAMLKIKHVPFQLFDVTITPIMFTLLFTYMFGGALAGSPDTYIQFLLPGILVQTILFITVYTGVGVNTDIHKGLFDLNRRARETAARHNKPLLATSDAHRLHAFGSHYTSVPRPREMTPEGILCALRDGPLRLTSPGSSWRDLLNVFYFVLIKHPLRKRLGINSDRHEMESG